MKKIIVSMTIAAAVVLGLNSSAAGVGRVTGDESSSNVLTQDTVPKKDTSKWNKKKKDPSAKPHTDTFALHQ